MDHAGLLQSGREKSRTARSSPPPRRRFQVPAAKVFFANAGGKGYYRSAYAPAQYAALVAQVETGLTPEERISLTGDEWAQVRADKATAGDYLALVAALSSDPNRAVLSNAVDKVSVITDDVASTQEERDALAAWVRRTFAPVYARLGNASASDTPANATCACISSAFSPATGKDPGLKAQALQIADQYLSDPASVDPTLGQIALGIAARKRRLGALRQAAKDLRDLERSRVAGDRAARACHLYQSRSCWSAHSNTPSPTRCATRIRPYQFNIAMRIPENRDQAWKFIKTHWDQVQAEFTTEMGSYLVDGTGNFCTVEARDDVKNFFAGTGTRSRLGP